MKWSICYWLTDRLHNIYQENQQNCDKKSNINIYVARVKQQIQKWHKIKNGKEKFAEFVIRNRGLTSHLYVNLALIFKLEWVNIHLSY